MTLTLIQGGEAAECVFCFRSRAEHDVYRDGSADNIQRRIWRALGQPCSAFSADYAAIFDQIQARPRLFVVKAGTFNTRTAAAAGRGAALARALLDQRQATQEGTEHGR